MPWPERPTELIKPFGNPFIPQSYAKKLRDYIEYLEARLEHNDVEY